ncbi:MAG: hypothetical protein M0004_14295 [Actinomycetota bacterium]|nr:hypothetical protein [Actinomycetota bacterium]
MDHSHPSVTTSAAAFLYGWVVLLIVSVGAPVPLRTLAVFSFAALGPALALRRFLPGRDRLERLVVSVAVSLCVAVVITLVLALGHVFSARLSIACIAAFDSLAVIADVLIGGRAAGKLATTTESR